MCIYRPGPFAPAGGFRVACVVGDGSQPVDAPESDQ